MERTDGMMRAVTLAFLLLMSTKGLGATLDEKANKEVWVGTLTDWPPYYTLDETGRPTGFAIEVFESVAERTGLNARYREYPSFPAALDALDRGDIDVIPSVGIVEGREFLFTRTFHTFEVSLFVRSSFRGGDNLENLDKVGVITANIGERLIEQWQAKTYSSVEAAFFGLLAGEVDGLVYPGPVLNRLARAANLADHIRQVDNFVYEVKRAIAIRQGETGLHALLDRALGEFVSSSEYRAIFAKWHQPEPSWWTVERVTATGLTLLGIVVVALLIWRYVTIRNLMNQLRFRSRLLDVIDQAVIAVDSEGKVIYWNKFAEELYGWQPDEVIGQPIIEITATNQSHDQAAEILQKLQQGNSWTGEFQVTRKDGTTFPALVTDAPIFDDDGNVTGLVGVSSDLTLHKELEQQLRQSQKMEAIGRLAGGIAHDFNNLLTILRGHVDLALDSVDPKDAVMGDLEEIGNVCERATRLTRQLLAFSRKQTLHSEVIDLRGVIEEFRKMLRRILRENIELVVKYGDNLWPVKMDLGQTEQILMNLAVNAGDAMPDGGTLTISVKNVSRDPDDTELDECDWVEITVHDTGSGMSPEIRDRIFDPFFTTKDAGEGTGLGLAMVHGIVTQNGGLIDVESEPGKGATFRIEFPRCRETAQTAVMTELDQESPGNDASILVVEDEDGVRRLIKGILEQSGYRVTEASDAE